MMRKKLLKILIAAIFIAAIFTGVILFGWYRVMSTPLVCEIGWAETTLQEVPARKVSDNEITIQSVWSLNVTLGRAMILTEGQVILSDMTCNRVVSLDIDSGQKRWEQTVSGPWNITYDRELDRIYVVSIFEHKREIVAIDLQSGEKLWANNEYNFQRVGLTVEKRPDNQVVVYIRAKNEMRTLDPQTGVLSEPQKIPSSDSQISGFQSFRRAPDGNLTAEYAQALEILTKLERELQWYDFVSNPAIQDGIIYVLDDRVRLILIDMTSQRVISTISFEATSDYLNRLEQSPDSSSRLRDSWLAINGTHIAIYFNDAKTVSLWRLSLP